MRTRLMGAIASEIGRRGLKQREAAALFRTTQPRISEIVRGKIDEFTIDSLVNMLSAAELPLPRIEPGPPVASGGPRDPVVEAYMVDVDRSLLRASLLRTPTERVQALAELQLFAAELRSGRRSSPVGS